MCELAQNLLGYPERIKFAPFAGQYVLQSVECIGA